MRKSKVKAKLARNAPVLITQLHLIDPSVYEMASLMGFDAIWMDMEHHGYSLETAGNLMRAARVGSSDILARPAKGEFMRMARMLEAGAHGILYPRCDDAAEAREVVRWSKFAPLGRRGFDGGNPDMPYCAVPPEEYVRFANEQTWIIIQIEEDAALEHVEEIARVEGVDAIILGPADYTVISGIPGQFNHPKVQQATQRIAAACKKAGKHWGLPAGSVEQTRRLLEMGARVIMHMADIVLVKNGLEQIQKSFSPLGFEFENNLASGGKSYLEAR